MPAPAPRRSDRIEPGYYRYRKVRNGPFVAARIAIRDGVIYVAEEDGPAHYAVSVTDFAELVTSSIMDGEAFRACTRRSIRPRDRTSRWTSTICRSI
jgi:hypothetical protein